MLIFIVVIIAILLSLQIFARPFLSRHIKKAIFIIPLVIFSVGVYYSFSQYSLWISAEPSKYLLPPYEPINYFLRYSFLKFFAPHVVSLILAAIFFAAATVLNKRGDERFFEREEIGLASIALFIAGFPGILFVFAFIVAAYLLIHIANLFLKRKLEVIPVYYLWLPGCLFAIILTAVWISRMNFWSSLIIS